ncbi:hypothetical protein [Sphingomicrobium astaxanthinifaciens]|uniref:hypothetical protein n=1 Tax=Sphingomicrobium astaxanthinifaciens TaxID=1227949 RepID=UPI001FCBF55C|nr:hypothetical protein [Sphingomicrobium astaxanthinifaciens]MCJ7421352.1 hypothetical protein [Sphingomicrobium astaxanthinifaciens]
MMDTGTRPLDHDDALEEFLATNSLFGGGLSNHGPMASEALDHMGATEWIDPFVRSYRPRLEPRVRPPARGGDWRAMLAEQLPDLVPAAAARAGHCLLRTAHAVRGIARAAAEGHVPTVRIDELGAALAHWRSDPGLPAPAALSGDSSVDDWSAELAPLATFEPAPGLLTNSLELAAAQPGYLDAVARLAPGADPRDGCDRLALRAVAGYLENEDFSARFTLLHGVTVSTMARVLVDHLDPPGQRRLEAAVAGFVAAAIIAFDRRTDTRDRSNIAAGPRLAARAAATLDDHTIKLTDACLGLAARTGSDLPLRAAELQVQLTQ